MKATAPAFVRRSTGPGQRLFLLLSACLFLLAALADPYLTVPRRTYDFLFVLDITGSMNVADAGPAGSRQRRLTFGKHLIRSVLGELPCGSRAGLGVFTEHRTFLLFAPVEICDNYLVISTMIDEIDRRMAWAELSEVAKGLYSGLESIATLASRSEEGATGKAQLVFMTDGHEAPPVHPALRPKFRGQKGEARGLIAGIGGATPVRIPRLDEEDRVIGYWTKDEVMQVDRHTAGRSSTQGGEAMVGIDSSDLQERIARGTEHLSSLHEDYLRQLAAETGLDYLRTTTDEAFARALLDPRYAKEQPAVTNVAWIPAGLSLLCLVYLFGSPLLRGRAAIGENPRRLHHRLRGTAPRRPARH